MHADRADRHDGRGASRSSGCPARTPSGRRTCSRSACCRGCTTGPPSRPIAFLRAQVRQAARHPRRQHRRVPGRLELRRDHRGVRGPVRGQAGADAAGHLPQHHRQPGAGLRPGRRRRRSPGCRCSSARTRSPRPPTSCTSCASTSGSASRTFQAEDEIAGIGAALGAAFGGALGVTTTSGPGIALKARDDRPGGDRWSCRWSSSTCSAAARRPACRPRPSRPTCCRRCSAATARRRCRSSRRSRRPTASTPRIEAARIALTYRTPVILLSDGYLANGSEPWQLPDVADLPDARADVRHRAQPRDDEGEPSSWPYLRDPETLARPWAVPGTPGLEHRIGGLEKADGTGNISYDPANHDFMVRTRAGQGRRASPTTSRRSRSTTRPATAARAGARLGLDVRPDRRGLPAGPRRRAARSRRPTCATSTRSRPTSATVLDALRPGGRPGDEPRPARHADPRRSTWSTSIGYNQVRGLPFTAAELAEAITEE